jgi:mono/diheme cytochrome c family protein
MTDEERMKVAAWIVQGAAITAAPRFEGEPDPARLEEARGFYEQRCVTCHGAEGRGDGPAAPGMLPRPTNLTDRLWHAQVSDEELAKVILEGGPSRGLAGTMPPSADLEERQELLYALVYLMRRFEAPAPAAAVGFPGTRSAPVHPVH